MRRNGSGEAGVTVATRGHVSRVLVIPLNTRNSYYYGITSCGIIKSLRGAALAVDVALRVDLNIERRW